MGCNVMYQCVIKMSPFIRMALDDFLQKAVNWIFMEKKQFLLCFMRLMEESLEQKNTM